MLFFIYKKGSKTPVVSKVLKVTLVFTLFTYDQIPFCVWSSVVLVNGQNPKGPVARRYTARMEE